MPRPPRRWLPVARSPSGRLDLSAPQLLVGSFAILIAAGTLGFLVLPGLWIGARPGFVDALFMATSAVCVTGLAVLDVSARMTFWGQLWLLLLIQLGGLGILTLATLAVAALGRRASLEFEEAAAGPTALLPEGGPRALVRSVVRVTLAVEAAGALGLWLAWRDEMGAAGALWPAVFHAVSSFCNAGFSTFGDSLVSHQHDVATLAIVASLVLVGGIGILVIEDLRARVRGRRRRVTLHTRLAIGMSAVLVAGALPLYLFFEWNGTLAAMSLGDRVANAFFMAVTPRTAGFNAVDYDRISNPSVVLTLALMWIGGSPGSTAGGVKTTTVALLALALLARLRGRADVSFANRSVPDATLQRAVAIAVGGILLLFAFVFLLLWSELEREGVALDRGRFVRLVFEAQSALGTVGLSMNMTGELTPVGRLLVVALMFLGRVGPLAVLEAMARRGRRKRAYRLGREDVLVS
ncbi:MAG: potassium transporter TrkH [Proteobacteria bacterium]|nr:MAG: potassium transporter TrkH [Pseudomonadota bacterium]